MSSEVAFVPIGVQFIDHVTLIVKDLEASRTFYCDVLGMQQVDRPNFSFGGSWFQAGDTQIHLILEHEKSSPAGEDMSRQKRSSRNRHFSFRIDDGDDAVRKLEAAGIPLLAGPKKRPDGAVQIFVRDPDGHVVELSTLPA